MTHDYKAALHELSGYAYDLPDELWETVLNALKLAINTPTPETADRAEALAALDRLIGRIPASLTNTEHKWNEEETDYRTIRAALMQPRMEVVDVNRITGMQPASSRYVFEAKGWNDCLDHIAAQGFKIVREV